MVCNVDEKDMGEIPSNGRFLDRVSRDSKSDSIIPRTVIN